MFKGKFETLNTAGGKHGMWIPDMEYKTSDKPTPEEVLTEEEKFKAICILKRSDENRYDGLLEELKSSEYAGKDK